MMNRKRKTYNPEKRVWRGKSHKRSGRRRPLRICKLREQDKHKQEGREDNTP